MKLEIDLKERTITTIAEDGTHSEFPLGSPEGFSALSKAWLISGWDARHVYTFTWLGRPIIQLPEDLIRLQEVIFQVKPHVIIETGVAHGGSLVFSASLLKLIHPGGSRRVIGADIEIRPHNRKAIEGHSLAGDISLIEGDAVDPEVVDRVRGLIPHGSTVFVMLDSCHSRDHVLNELRQYAPLVTPGSYIVATDGIMRDLAGAPRAAEDWGKNNPYEAVRDFLKETSDFVSEEPEWLFNESDGLTERVTHWPAAYLRRLPAAG